jgi:hypothetical protein
MSQKKHPRFDDIMTPQRTQIGIRSTKHKFNKLSIIETCSGVFRVNESNLSQI